MDNIYRENILDHYKNPRNFGKMKKADITFQESNITCGDKIAIQIKFITKNAEQRTIEDIKFYGEGCAISLACASMLTEKVIGKSVTSVQKLAADDIIKMLGIQLSPIRVKCALLPLEALHKTLALARNK